MGVVGVLTRGVVIMLSDGAIALMNLIRAGSTTLHQDGELSTQDFHLLMDLAESILREHEGE